MAFLVNCQVVELYFGLIVHELVALQQQLRADDLDARRASTTMFSPFCTAVPASDVGPPHFRCQPRLSGQPERRLAGAGS
jgi:hypothetical protein